VADEIKIENIGGENGVASEVTLVRLVAAMEKMAKTSGNDPKSQGAKTQQAYNKAQQNGVKVSTKHREAVKDNTTAVKNNTKYLNLMGGGLLKLATASIGAAIGGLKGLTEELISGGDSLSDFAKHVPVVGSTLTMFTGILDRSYASFQSMALAGADFGYSLADLRSTAAEARLPLETFSAMVAQNTENLAAFGGNVTRGARQIAGMTDALGKDTREEFLAMGFTMEDLNESMSRNAYLNRAGSRTEILSKAQNAEAAASLTKNMLTLSKLTGQDVKTQQDKIAQAQMDFAFQMELAKLDKKEREKLNAAMAEAQATGGKVAVDALKAEFLGMPPVTRELQLFTATQSENASLVSAMLSKALDKSTTLEQFESGQADRMANYLEAQVAAAGELDAILKLAAAGGEGIPSEISALFAGQVDLIAKYFTESGEGLIFAKDEFLADYAAGKIKPEEGGELDSMGTFIEALGNARLAIVDNFINPIVDLLSPVIKDITASFSSFVGEEGTNTKFQNALKGLSTYINQFKIDFKEDPSKAVTGVFKDISKSISEFFMGGVDENGKEFEGFYQSTLAPMFVKIGEDIMKGIGVVFKEGVTSLFQNPLVIGAMVGGIGLMFAGGKIKTAMALGAASLFSRLKTPGASPTVTRAPAGAIDPKTGKKIGGQFQPVKKNPLLSFGKGAARGMKFIPGVGLVAAGAMGLYDGFGGFNADEDAGFGESLGNAGSSIMNGLTFGLLGSSPQEIAAEAEAKKLEEAEKKDLAKDLGLTTESAKLLERMAGIGGGMERVAGAFERIDKLERFSENVNAIQKGLDISELSKYNVNMQEIARSLEDMNKALAEDNKGLFGGSGVASADLLKKMGGSGVSEETANNINTALVKMSSKLDKIITHTKATADAVD
jgi:hypothetical protein